MCLLYIEWRPGYQQQKREPATLGQLRTAPSLLLVTHRRLLSTSPRLGKDTANIFVPAVFPVLGLFSEKEA